MQAVPYIIMAAGTYAQMSSARQERNERRNIANRQLERDDQAAEKAIGQVQQEGQRFNQDARMEGMAAQEQKILDQTSADVQGAGGGQIGTAGDAGNVSADFVKDKAQRAVDEGTRLTSIAREAAKSRSAGYLGQEDALGQARLSGNLQNIFGTNRNMGRAASLSAQSVEAPGYGAIGKVASSIGSGMASGGAGTSGINWDPDGSYSKKYSTGRGGM